MIVLDKSMLVAGLTGPVVSRGALRAQLEGGRPIVVPSLVLYEFLRGPRKPEKVGMQEALFRAEHAIPFGPAEAELSARLYRSVRRARGREIDLAIAACAIVLNAEL